MSNATGITPPPKPEDPPPKFAYEWPSNLSDSWTTIQGVLDTHAALVAELAPHAAPGETALDTLKRILSAAPLTAR